MNDLVIVESPTKARTLSRFLGDKYQIEASYGHVRDLPKSEMGVDIEHDFEPKYIVPRDKTKRINQLKKVTKDAKTLWLATDPDREGEAIAWHIAQIMRSQKSKVEKPDVRHPISKIRRVVFHEITEEAVKEAFEYPRSIDMKLVDAQQARRVLDRLVGYKLSPLLWKKVKSGLSAGRVQSVALRLIVEREREIEKFKPVEYWTIIAQLMSPAGVFHATLLSLNGKKLTIKNKSQSDEHIKVLEKADYQVDKIHKKEVKRYPYPPFTTSTLQQTASHLLGFTAKKTMSVAQHLYEHGLITYMRTDSVNLSPLALNSVRIYIEESFGKNYLPNQVRVFRTRSKLAQEAHEAIRPTDIRYQSSDIRAQIGITKDHLRLYDLIWKRMVACQMKEAVLDQTTVELGAKRDDVIYTLRATGSVVKFDGWLKVFSKGGDEEETREKVLPPLTEKEMLKLIKLLPEQHFTESPPRYNEASLIKKLEELGIGRPSTYAPIISTILDRIYVERQDRKFIPTPLGLAVTDFLVKNFPDIIDYSFTAQMEDELDEIAKGEKEWKPIIKDFYTPFEKKVEETEGVARVRLEVEKSGKICPECGKELIIRYGRFGKFLACSGFPECKHTQGLEESVTGVRCPKDQGELVIRRTKKGRTFYGCKNYPSCKFASWTKPKSN